MERDPDSARHPDPTEARTARLEEKARRLDALVENARDLIYEFDFSADRATFVSPSVERILGYGADEFCAFGLTRHLEELIHPTDRRTVSDLLDEIRRRPPAERRTETLPDIRYRKKNGGYAWLSVQATFVSGADGTLERQIVTARDVTEFRFLQEEFVASKAVLEDVVKSRTRKLSLAVEALNVEVAERRRAEETLTASELLTRTIIDALPEAVHVIDERLRIVLINRTFSDWLEKLLLDPDVTGKTVDEAFPFVNRHVIDEYRRLFETGRSVFTEETTLVNGRRIATETAKIPIVKNGVAAQAITVIRDVSEKKHSAELIQEAYSTLEERVRMRTAELEAVNRTLSELEGSQKAILNNIPDIAWLKDGDGRFVAVNEPFARSCGFSAAEIIGKTDFDIWPSEFAERYCVDDREVTASGRVKRVEEPLADATGKVRWIETIKAPIVAPDGKVIGTTGIARDITQRRAGEKLLKRTQQQLEGLVRERTRELEDINAELKNEIAERMRAEKNLREREQFLANVFASLQDGLSVLDPDLNVVQVNPTMERWHAARMPLIGKKCYAAFHGRNTPCPDCPTQKTLSSGKTAGAVLRRRTEDAHEPRWVDLQCFPLAQPNSGRVVGVIEYVRDVTEKRRTEIALLESEATARALLDASNDVACLINPDGRIKAANRALAKKLNRAPEQLIGRTVFDMFPERAADERRKWFTEVIGTGKPLVVEDTLSGNVIYETTIYPVFDARRDVTSVAIFARDVTVSRQAREKLRQSEIKLQEQKTVLEQKNITLRELIKQIEFEKKQVEEQVVMNVDSVLMPLLDRLKLSLGKDAGQQINLIKNAFGELTGSFGMNIARKSLNLTPREVEICTMIKSGLSSKDISRLLGISLVTTERHRNNVRKKLGISNSRINLTSYLRKF